MNTPKNKGSIYSIFQITPFTVSEKFFCESLNASRTDARLYEVVTEHVRDFWWAMEPAILNKQIKKCENGFLIKAIVASIFDYCEFEQSIRSEFTAWSNIALAGVKDLKSPEFLCLANRLSKKFDQYTINETLPCFKRHKLYFRDSPFNKGLPKDVKSRSHKRISDRFSSIDLIKVDAVLRVKRDSLELNNTDIISKYDTNRSFVSRILNNTYEGIKIDLFEKILQSPQY